MEPIETTLATRLIVKSLPKNIDDSKLRSHFSSVGAVTDAKVVRTKDGRSRLFGFVGFATEMEASLAVKHFNQSFISTSRISVEFARSRGDTNISRAWSKYSEGSSKNIKNSRSKDSNAPTENFAVEIINERQDDSTSNIVNELEKKEFLEVMKRRSNAKFWANDDVGSKSVPVPENNQQSDSDSSDKPVEDISHSNISDMDWLQRKKAKISSVVGTKESLNDEQNIESQVNNIMEKSGRLFIRNLPYSCSEDDIRQVFSKFGDVSSVHMAVNDMMKGKGFAFVQFKQPVNALNAMNKLDGTPFQGRLMHVIPARKAPGEISESDVAGSHSYKVSKENERKAKANQIVGWNASFLRGDTVVDALSQRLNVKKGEYLDGEQGDMAVRLALGETQLIAENKEYFMNEGIDLDVLVGHNTNASKQQRSDRIILVKNLPHTSQASDLVKLFNVTKPDQDESVGGVERVLLAPSRSIALVEFRSSVDSRRAFKKLAYTRYQHVPLYLEWAPTAAIKQKPEKSDDADSHEKYRAIQVDDDEGIDASTVYVKNLAWATDQNSLRKCFEKVGGTIRAVAIPRKKPIKGTSSEAANLSMGFGFVEFSDIAAANRAISTLQGTILDGHALELKHSTKRITPATLPSLKKADGRSKIIVRNVAFQANASEIRALFSSFGTLRRVKMPKKFDGSHRGFAFVDFATAKEAENAFKSLSSTHLYGRHLVLEWAEDVQDQVDVLRTKASQDVKSSKMINKRKKFNQDENEFVDDSYE